MVPRALTSRLLLAGFSIVLLSCTDLFTNELGTSEPCPRGADQMHTFRAVHFTDRENGWVAGICGTIFQTGNGGQTWWQQESGTTENLADLTVIREESDWVSYNLWAVGWLGTILHSSNRGLTWEPQESGTGMSLLGVHFVDSSTGWAVGWNGTVVHTTNGGREWKIQSSPTHENLNNVFFADAEHGWAVGSGGAVIHTNDGGESWILQESDTNQQLVDVHFTDRFNGRAVGWSGAIIRTTDGGENWARELSGTISNLRSVHVAGSGPDPVTWAVGSFGEMHFKLPEDEAWVFKWTEFRQLEIRLKSIFFVDEEYGWIAGQSGTVLHTQDGGETWEMQISDLDNWEEGIDRHR